MSRIRIRPTGVPWLLTVALLGGAALPAAAQSPPAPPDSHSYHFVVASPQDEELLQREAGEEEVAVRDRRQVKVVLAGGGEPKVYEWKTSTGEVHQLPSEGWTYLTQIQGRGYLGVHLVELTPELRAFFGAPEDAGVLIGKIDPEGPAAQADLRVGDVLTRIDGEKVDSPWEARQHVRRLEDGEKTTLTVVRERRPLELTATVAEKERAEVDIRTFVAPRVVGGEPVHVFDESEIVQNLREFEVRLSNPAFQSRIHTLRSLESELEKRIVELEKRLGELEKKLEDR